MAAKDHLHPDHTCPRCQDEENALRPDYVRPARKPSTRTGRGLTWERW